MTELVEDGRIVRWIGRWANEMPNEVATECALMEQRLELTQAKLEAMEQDAAARKQSWRDAKDQAIELATAILAAPYWEHQGGLTEFLRWTKIAYAILGDPVATQQQEEQRE